MKTVVFDIDGVLAEHNKSVASEVSSRLRIIAQHARLVFASGKPAPYLEGLARGMGLLDVIVVAENGAVIYFPPERLEIVFSDFMPVAGDELETAYTGLRNRLGKSLWFQHNKVLITAFPRGDLGMEELAGTAKGVITENNLKHLDLLVHVDAVDIVPQGVDKGWALERLVSILDIDRSELIIVGNGLNDLSMLEKAGLSICIGSIKEVVDAADLNFQSIVYALDFILEEVRD